MLLISYDILGCTFDIEGHDLRYRNIFLIHIVYDIVGPYTPTTSYVMTYDIVGHEEIISYTISRVCIDSANTHDIVASFVGDTMLWVDIRYRRWTYDVVGINLRYRRYIFDIVG